MPAGRKEPFTTNRDFAGTVTTIRKNSKAGDIQRQHQSRSENMPPLGMNSKKDEARINRGAAMDLTVRDIMKEHSAALDKGYHK